MAQCSRLGSTTPSSSVQHPHTSENARVVRPHVYSGLPRHSAPCSTLVSLPPAQACNMSSIQFSRKGPRAMRHRTQAGTVPRLPRPGTVQAALIPFHYDVLEASGKSMALPRFAGVREALSSLLLQRASSDGELLRSGDANLNQETTQQEGCLKREKEAPWQPAARELPRSEWAYRRQLTLYGLGVLLSLPAVLPFSFQPALAEALLGTPEAASVREEATESASRVSRPAKYSADTTVTQRVYLDFSLCPTAVRLDRTLGDRSQICHDGEPIGRVVLGLYGNQVPVTVQHFVNMVTGKAGSTYKGSIIHKSFPGQYIMAGRQGSVDKGEVRPPSELPLNSETVQSRAFLLGHQRPGTVSLALSENDDEDALKQSSSYRNVEFLITTGPGPATQLDSQNVVFGTVLEGMEVVRSIAAVPTYQPDERIRQFNDFAVLLGDERAAKGRASWAKPLKSVVISDCGLVEVTPPLLPPSQP